MLNMLYYYVLYSFIEAEISLIILYINSKKKYIFICIVIIDII